MSDVAPEPQGPEITDTGTSPETTPAAPDAPSGAAEQDQSGSSGGNPAWDSLRQKLDPVLFKSIEGDLKNWDRDAQKRIESVNQQFAPFKALIDQGLNPQSIQQSVMIAREIDRDPVGFHNKLTSFLQQTGRMPQTQAELKDVVEGDDDTGDEGQQPEDDPRLKQLEEQQEQIKQFIQQQQREAVQRQAESELDSETQALRAAHQELSDEDVQEVIRRAATTALMNRQQGNNNIPSLEDAYQEMVAYRNRILSAPRAGDSAPRLLPTSGGVPSSDGQRKSLGQLSKDETIDLFAGLVSGGRKP